MTDNAQTSPDESPRPLLVDSTTWQMQVRNDDGSWIDYLNPRQDRDEMTRIQAARAREFPQEKRRILGSSLKIWEDEVEGDGEGETSREELFARNEENTRRRIEQEKEQGRTGR